MTIEDTKREIEELIRAGKITFSGRYRINDDQGQTVDDAKYSDLKGDDLINHPDVQSFIQVTAEFIEKQNGFFDIADSVVYESYKDILEGGIVGNAKGYETFSADLKIAKGKGLLAVLQEEKGLEIDLSGYRGHFYKGVIKAGKEDDQTTYLDFRTGREVPLTFHRTLTHELSHYFLSRITNMNMISRDQDELIAMESANMILDGKEPPSYIYEAAYQFMAKHKAGVIYKGAETMGDHYDLSSFRQVTERDLDNLYRYVSPISTSYDLRNYQALLDLHGRLYPGTDYVRRMTEFYEQVELKDDGSLGYGVDGGRDFNAKEVAFMNNKVDALKNDGVLSWNCALEYKEGKKGGVVIKADLKCN